MDLELNFYWNNSKQDVSHANSNYENYFSNHTPLNKSLDSPS